MNQIFFRFVLAGIALMLITGITYAQSRSYIRERIEEWGECKTVAITMTGGDLAIYGKNGWAKTGPVPNSLIDKIKEFKAEGKMIQDVILTETGKWILLYGTNGLAWSAGWPTSLVTEMREYNGRNERITSIAANDSGEWLVIGEDNYSASSTSLLSFVSSGSKDYGLVWTAHFNDNGIVVVYEKGIKYKGKVPQSVIDAFQEVDFDVYRFKFLPDGSYFMADLSGSYSYSM